MSRNKDKNNQMTEENGKPKKLTKRQKNWIYTGIFLTIVLIFFIVNNSNGEGEQGPYPPNYISDNAASQQSAPDFVLPTIEGKEFRLSDYKGKVVLLNFWVTWMDECRKSIPELIMLKNDFGNKSFEVVGISLDGITRDGSTIGEVQPFSKENKINYPVVLSDMQMINKYDIKQNILTYFLINKDGKIVKRFNHAVPKETLAAEIEKLLKEG